MSTVIVINKNAEAYERRFDGDMYRFPPNEAVTVPELAAAYLFGYGKTDEDRQRIVVRNGWQRNGLPGDEFGPDGAMKRLKNFTFRKGPEPTAAVKPEKKLAPSQQKMLREPTGINAVSASAKDDGKTILPRAGVRIPGSANLLPTAPPAS